MTKVLLSFVVIAAMIISVHAQETLIIPKVGVSLSNFHIKVDGDKAEDIKYKSGLLLGAGLQLGVTENFAMQPELLFIQKGYAINQNGTDFKATLNYIELPVLAKAIFGPVYINVGPSFGVGIGGKSKYKVGGRSIEEDVNFGSDNNDDLKAFDIGLQAGGGIMVDAGSGKFVLDLRYGSSLNNLYPGDSGDKVTYRNGNFSFSVGYAFRLSK